MAKSAKSLLVLDHHKTAAEALKWMPKAVLNPASDVSPDPWNNHINFDASFLEMQGHPACAAWFDMEQSGAMLAWKFFHPGKPVPKLVQHVQDRDLWLFKIPGTREIQACVFSYEYEFRRWDALAVDCEHEQAWAQLRAEGRAIERAHFKDIAELLAVTRRKMIIGGHVVPVANLPYTMASDAAHRLCAPCDDGLAGSWIPPFAACYFDKADARVFSLRSREDGTDVSAIAKSYGGGGHKNAAGFSMPLGWEGDQENA